MKGWKHRSKAALFVWIFAVGLLCGCASLRSSAAEEVTISESVDWSGHMEGDSDTDSGGDASSQGESERDPEDCADEASVSEEEGTGRTIYVYICGQVREEGVYRMPEDCRVYQVIEEAGGVTEKADISAVNQAAKVEDGEKIYIPGEGEAEAGQVQIESSSGGADIADASEGGKVNINTADKDRLMTLSGIGESRAESIIQYREEHGSFSKPEDLKNVSGIGDGIYGKIAEDICV